MLTNTEHLEVGYWTHLATQATLHDIHANAMKRARELSQCAIDTRYGTIFIYLSLEDAQHWTAQLIYEGMSVMLHTQGLKYSRGIGGTIEPKGKDRKVHERNQGQKLNWMIDFLKGSKLAPKEFLSALEIDEAELRSIYSHWLLP